MRLRNNQCESASSSQGDESDSNSNDSADEQVIQTLAVIDDRPWNLRSRRGSQQNPVVEDHKVDTDQSNNNNNNDHEQNGKKRKKQAPRREQPTTPKRTTLPLRDKIAKRKEQTARASLLWRQRRKELESKLVTQSQELIYEQGRLVVEKRITEQCLADLQEENKRMRSIHVWMKRAEQNQRQQQLQLQQQHNQHQQHDDEQPQPQEPPPALPLPLVPGLTHSIDTPESVAEAVIQHRMGLLRKLQGLMTSEGPPDLFSIISTLEQVKKCCFANNVPHQILLKQLIADVQLDCKETLTNQMAESIRRSFDGEHSA